MLCSPTSAVSEECSPFSPEQGNFLYINPAFAAQDCKHGMPGMPGIRLAVPPILDETA
jgi:hypothetical protein